MFFSLLATIAAKFATCLMIYRKKEYKDLKANIETQDLKLKKIEEHLYSLASNNKI